MKRIVTITGPTCSGKSTLEHALADLGFGQVVSHTSREPRAGEIDGRSYYFTHRSLFSADADHFIESVEYDGNLYGVHASEVSRLASMGYDELVIVAEPVGIRQIRKWCAARDIRCESIWLNAPEATLYERFLERFYADAKTSVSGAARKYAARLHVLLGEQIAPTDVPWICMNGANAPEFSAERIASFQ